MLFNRKVPVEVPSSNKPKERDIYTLRLHAILVRGTINDAESKANEVCRQMEAVLVKIKKMPENSKGEEALRQLQHQKGKTWVCFIQEKVLLEHNSKMPLGNTVQVKTIDTGNDSLDDLVAKVNAFSASREVTRIDVGIDNDAASKYRHTWIAVVTYPERL